MKKEPWEKELEKHDGDDFKRPACEKVWLEWIWRHTDYHVGGFCDSWVTHRYRSDMHWGAANLDARDWPKAR